MSKKLLEAEEEPKLRPEVDDRPESELLWKEDDGEEEDGEEEKKEAVEKEDGFWAECCCCWDREDS